MTTPIRNYLLDSDVLMQAHKAHYSFDICPGFWSCIGHYFEGGKLISIDKVKDEILAGETKGGRADALCHWAKNSIPEGFWANTAQTDVLDAYRNNLQLVKSAPNYLPSAIKDYANKADGWLVAFARAKGYILVTHEIPAPSSRHNVKIPDACKLAGVETMNSFAMLRVLAAQFDWKKP